MIRVLHVLGQLNIGGAESRIMDLYRSLDRNRVQFDFVVHGENRGYFEDEIESLGGTIYHIPRFKIYNICEYKKAWNRLLEGNAVRYSFIQGHMTSTASIYLPIAKEFGIKTIAHARSAGVDAGPKGKITKLMRRNLSKKADYLFSCSQRATEAVFGKNINNEKPVVFLPNCIDVSKFQFNSDTRTALRQELNIGSSHLYGHVGRFHYAKNHEFLLNVFSKILEFDRDSKLILVGDGSRMQEMIELAEKLKIKEHVIFTGVKTNISDYYQAMDCFIYPSRYEGLPGTVVEAQGSGLPIIMSDEICNEVVITDLVKVCSLNDTYENWAKIAYNIIDDSKNRSGYCDEVINAGFNVSNQAKKLMEFYESGNIRALN